ncbi:MAG: hypothetical protein VB092_02895 [Oscillospiraceae bacterium]|nr:hypothetical protein [Oscillospiraceae bacterium]
MCSLKRSITPAQNLTAADMRPPLFLCPEQPSDVGRGRLPESSSQAPVLPLKNAAGNFSQCLGADRFIKAR